MKLGLSFLVFWTLMGTAMSGCASVRSILAVNSKNRAKPIDNPFLEYQANPKNQTARNMILRTKKGDRSVELEIPGTPDQMSDFVLPVAPAFAGMRNSSRGIASNGGIRYESQDFGQGYGQSYGHSYGMNSDSSSLPDESLKSHPPTLSDREIEQTMAHSQPEYEERRRSIEQGLHLTADTEDSILDGRPSYLAQLDHIKQLYKQGRFEASLVETDEMVKQYPTDPKLYEMRGTLLDRLGRRELALKSWNQALRFDQSNHSLRKFIERKTASFIAAPSSLSSGNSNLSGPASLVPQPPGSTP